MKRDIKALIARVLAEKHVPVKPTLDGGYGARTAWSVHARKHADAIAQRVGALLDCEADRIGDMTKYGQQLRLEFSCGTVVHVEVYVKNDFFGVMDESTIDATAEEVQADKVI